jgi:hypothetical protein
VLQFTCGLARAKASNGLVITGTSLGAVWPVNRVRVRDGGRKDERWGRMIKISVVNE